MSELIDGSCFKISELELLNNYHQNQEDKTYPSNLQTTMFSFKSYRESRFKAHSYHAVIPIRKMQTSMDICLQMVFSDTQFNLSARRIKDHKFESIKSTQIRKMLLKQLCKRSCLALVDPYKIMIEMGSGDFLMSTPMYSCEIKEIELSRKLVGLADGLTKTLIAALMHIQKMTRFGKQQQSSPKQQRVKQTLKYSLRCTTIPELTMQSQNSQYKSLLYRYAASKCDLESLYGHHQATLNWSKLSLGSVSFYGCDIQADNKIKYLSQINIKERQMIQQEIGIPPLICAKKESKYMFNHCYFFQKSYPQKKIGSGGNAFVIVLKPDIYEYSSTSYDPESSINRHQNPSKYMSKHLVYKENIQNNYFDHGEEPVVTHQTKIVAYFRGGSCMFLPKYYLNIDKKSPYYKKLFLDYLPGDTLDNFLAFNKHTVSIYTKIYFFIQILQALRFVGNHGIVHLDVKENNIIVLKNMVCKLIDFGESYHYKVCGQRHKPKYTLLYASPQLVTAVNGRLFIEKSDIFSFGIMAHKILFNRYPYQFRDPKSFEKNNFQQNLRHKTFYCPEQIEQYGHKDVMGIIYQSILRCIDMNQSKRPYFDWITLIYKSCFSILTSQ